jgi:hypothetical protein
VALTIGLTACQPSPSPATPPTDQPGQTPSSAPVIPGTTTPVNPAPIPGTTINGLTARMVVPAGAIAKLRTGLRTQATDDVTTADLDKLTLTVDGKTFGRDQFTFTDVSTDTQGNLIATLKVDDPLVPYTVLTLNTPSGHFALKTIIPASGTGVQIDLSSTARALIAERMQEQGRTYDEAAIPAESIAVIADRLLNMLTSTSTTDILHAEYLIKAVRLVTDAVLNGKGTDTATLNQIRSDTNSPPAGGGGGGGGGGSTSPVLKLRGTVRVGGVAKYQAMVQLNTTGGTVVAKTATAVDGTYAFYDIPDGTYILTVAVNGAVQSSKTVTIPSGDT